VTGGENLSLRDGRWDGAVYAIVSDYALLEPFTLQASLKSGPTSFGGMYRVDEKRLEFLNAA
jgi:hypothetical protein